VIFLALVAGYGMYQKQSNQRIVDTVSSVRAEVMVSRNKTRGLTRTLKAAQKDNKELLELFKALEERPEKVRTVIKTVTVMQPASSEPLIVDELPDEHLFRLDNNIVVGRFWKPPADTTLYAFETYGLEFKAQYAITDENTAALLQIRSSFDGEWVDVPVELTVTRLNTKPPFFAIHPGLGGTISVPAGKGSFSIYTSFLHPTLDLDILSLRVGLSSVPRLGIDLLGYNIAKPLPFFNDLWLYAGGSIDTDGVLSIDFTLGTKL